MLKFGKYINNFYSWDIIKIIISVGKEKVQFTLTFYLKRNIEVQLDLQRLEIFIFSSLLPSLPPGKMLEEKLTYGFAWFEIFAWFLLTYFRKICPYAGEHGSVKTGILAILCSVSEIKKLNLYQCKS